MRQSRVPVRASCTAVILMICGIAGASPAQAGGADVQQQLFNALGRGDVDGALALFTDDAVIDTESGVCAETACVGKAAIRRDLARYVADKSRRLTIINSYAAGMFVVTRFEARSVTVRQAGVARIILLGMHEMRGDKIAAVRCCLPDLTDPQTNRFISWENSQR